jgi:hypothetical protein
MSGHDDPMIEQFVNQVLGHAGDGLEERFGRDTPSINASNGKRRVLDCENNRPNDNPFDSENRSLHGHATTFSTRVKENVSMNGAQSMDFENARTISKPFSSSPDEAENAADAFLPLSRGVITRSMARRKNYRRQTLLPRPERMAASTRRRSMIPVPSTVRTSLISSVSSAPSVPLPRKVNLDRRKLDRVREENSARKPTESLNRLNELMDELNSIQDCLASPHAKKTAYSSSNSREPVTPPRPISRPEFGSVTPRPKQLRPTLIRNEDELSRFVEDHVLASPRVSRP